MEFIRTDLAEEWRDLAKEGKEKKGEPDGIVYREETKENIRVSHTEIVDERGEKALGKPAGNYITVSFPTATDLDYRAFLLLCDTVAGEIRKLVGNKRHFLVCGIGNEQFSCDSIGVAALHHLLVTHHVKNREALRMFADVAAIAPGIMAKTGMESAEIIRHAVNHVKPDMVIAIDALAARKADRLARTVQLCDTGLSPGAGIYNNRMAVNRETLGVPVLAIGVPTVVDAATLVADALRGQETNREAMEKLRGLFVAPKEIDLIAKNMAKLLGYSLNRALHGDFPYEEMAMLA